MTNLQNLWYRLTTPKSMDDDDQRREFMTRVIFIILVVVGSVFLVVFFIGWIMGTTPGPSLGVTAGMELFLVAGWGFSDKGYWRFTSYVPPLLFLLLALQLNVQQGLGTIAMLQYTIALLLTIILVGDIAQWVMLGLCISAYLIIGWMHVQGNLPPAPVLELNYAFFAIPVSGMLIFITVLQWFYSRQFRRTMAEARTYAAELTAYQASLEEQVAERTAELQESFVEREQLHQQVLDSQQQLIRELSTPVIPLMEGVIVMPLVGSIDTLRARDVTRSLLAGISEHQAKVVIVDITGVAMVDTGVVNYLNKTIQAARLKGARTIVTGISDAVAETIVELGIDWSNIETLRDLQTGLTVALGSLN